MSEDREESRHLMPQTPNAKANFDLFGTLVAFLGVVLIAHPTSLFSSASPDGGDATAAAYVPDTHNSTAPTGGGNPGMDHEATPAERLRAVGVALVGVP
ncbi:hypothetical protein BN1723_014130 [Verticillium longisporum]|uniref:Uncharacterized protein n=1 Tax=Verticillium longisporum TaxID=100787 RepID=A0A0G4M2K6_VERLO|nr:hypothetical protein BN1723_014130 [Verticillium longisporum]